MSVTIETISTIAFEAAPEVPGGMPLPDVWEGHRVRVCFAAAVVGKSKSELADMWNRMGTEMIDLHAELREVADYFDAVAAITRAAESRLFIAGAAAVADHDDGEAQS